MAEKISVRSHALASDPGVGLHDGSFDLIASRLSPEKGVAEAVAGWLGSGVDGELLVAGEGPDRARIEAMAQGQPRIRIAGAIPRAELLTLMGQARVLLLPSLWTEPAAPPLVAVEAISTGLPVVASDVGELGEWVRRTGVGWTVAPGNTVAWAEIIAVVGRAGEERAARGRVARQEYLRSHSAAVSAQSLSDVYERVCAVRDPAHPFMLNAT